MRCEALSRASRSLHGGRGLDPDRLVAFRLQGLKDLLAVLLAAGLDCHVELCPLRRHIEKEPPMIDLENIGAKLAESGGDLPEHAGPVWNGQPERNDAILA